MDLTGSIPSLSGWTPAGFIFHMSRSGSTLMAQMLAQAPAHLVLSEAGPLDGVLRARWRRPDLSDEERGAWLRWIVGALGQRRDDCQKRVFVKFDAWSVLDLALVRRAFPAVPWLFLYRDPVEVLASHAARLGAHLIPGILPPGLVGMSPADVASIPPVEYQARILARICEAALEHRDDPLATFVDHAQLPGFVVIDLPSVCSISLGAPEVDLMLQAAERDAKNPAIPFDHDRVRARGQAPPAVVEAAHRWLGPLHDRLQEARATQDERRRSAHAC